MRGEATGIGMREEGASEMRDVKREMRGVKRRHHLHRVQNRQQ
jgi:hypothetical protein